MHHRRSDHVLDVRISISGCLRCAEPDWVLLARLYGISALQTYIYYKENPKDLVRVKILVSIDYLLPSRAAFLTRSVPTSRSVLYCECLFCLECGTVLEVEV